MPKQVRLRRGTTAQHASFTGAQGEVTYDTDKKTLVAHDGVTAGGIPGAKMALNIFRREIDLSMAQMGAPKISDLGPQFLMWKDEEDLRRNRR